MITQVKILQSDILSDNWYILKKIKYEYTDNNGDHKMQTREVYDRGNGAVILLYNDQTQTVILTKQFRLPSFVNGNHSGMLIEACAGLLDKDNPEECIKRETEEETGYKISQVTRVFDAYMSPGSVTEILHFFIAPYTPMMKVSEGGGVDHEEENIDVLEYRFNEALSMIETGEIKDAKTIMLLQYLRIKEIL